MTRASRTALFQRDDELHLLAHLWSDSRAGHGSVAVITSPVACGKTALLNAFAERVADEATYRTATCSRAERDLPFGVIGQLLPGSELDAALGDRAASDALATDGEVDPQVLHRLCMALIALTDERPLVIGIDDVYHADVPSLMCLLFLVRRLRSARILLLLTGCEPGDAAYPPFIAEVLRTPRCHQIRLGPLTEGGVAELAAHRLAAPTAELVPAWYAASGGNPMLVRALIEDHEAAGSVPDQEVRQDASGQHPPAVDNFGRSLLACLYRGEPEVLQIAAAVAVLGRTAVPGLLARLAGTTPEAAARATHAMTAAGLLQGSAYRHPRARAAVLGALTTGRRAAMHQQAAQLLHEAGARAIVVARHLLCAADLDSPWAVPVLREAAQQALMDGQVQLAVRCLNLIDKMCDTADRAQAKMDLSRAEWLINPAALMRNLPEISAAVRSGQLRGRHATDHIGHLLWHGQSAAAVDLLDHLSADGPDESTRAAIRAARVWLSYSYPPLVTDGPRPPAGQSAGAESRDPAKMEIQAAIALEAVLYRGADQEAVGAAERILQSSWMGGTSLWSAVAALTTLVYADHPEIAAPWCRPLMDEAAARGARTWQAIFTSLDAEIALRMGDPARAAEQALTALRQISAQSWGIGIGGPLGTLVSALVAMGRYEAAAEHLKRPVPKAMLQTPFGLHYLYARGRYHLAIDQVHTALGHFRSCGELMARWHLDLPSMVPWRVDAAHACLRLGQTTEARELAREQLSRVAAGHSRTRGMSLRLLAATRRMAQRPDLLTEAVEVLQTCGDRLELAHALADLGAAHVALGQASRARFVIRRAYHLARDCQAGPLSQALLPHVTASGAEPAAENPAPAAAPATEVELSEAERRVATLAAQGHTNRQIARRLYITVSTVEQHLTRIYRKLRVRSRADIPAQYWLEAADAG